jgi:hypothetical protein
MKMRLRFWKSWDRSRGISLGMTCLSRQRRLTNDVAMDGLAIIGLLFFGYCGAQVVRKWEHRNAIEKTFWFIVIMVGGGYCVSVIIR